MIKEVIIVSKTKMQNHACVGAITRDGRFLRLLTPDGSNQPTDTDLNIRQIWNINFKQKQYLRPPHVEDVIVTSASYKEYLDSSTTMLKLLLNLNIHISKGRPDILFDGLLQWSEAGSGFISSEGKLPCSSVGFWIPDHSLRKIISYDKVRYVYPSKDGIRTLPYVGYEAPVDMIPYGTLLRVSLARWFDQEGKTEERCYLQLSGWYDIANAEI